MLPTWCTKRLIVPYSYSSLKDRDGITDLLFFFSFLISFSQNLRFLFLLWRVFRSSGCRKAATQRIRYLNYEQRPTTTYWHWYSVLSAAPRNHQATHTHTLFPCFAILSLQFSVFSRPLSACFHQRSNIGERTHHGHTIKTTSKKRSRKEVDSTLYQ